MSIRPDIWIKRMALEYDMIKPFESEQIKKDNISYGLSSYGYDIRIADEFKIFKGPGKKGPPLESLKQDKIVIDPKKIEHSLFEDFRGNT